MGVGTRMITVVIVTYNSTYVLPTCIDSLERCTSVGDIELILVDNCSSDETWPWIESQFQRLRSTFASVIMKRLPDNRGYSYANNQGMKAANGSSILLLNPDTVVGPTSIEACVTALFMNKHIGAIGCRLEVPNGNLDLACKRSLPTLWNSFTRLTLLSRLFPRSALFASYNLTYLDDKGSYSVGSLCGAFLMVPRIVYEQVGGLDEKYFMYGEDIDWCRTIANSGHLIWYLGTETTIHLKGGNGGKRSPLSIRSFYDSMTIYFEKYYSYRYRTLTKVLIRMAIRTLKIFHLCFNYVKHPKMVSAATDSPKIWT